MDFCEAVLMMKLGKKVKRADWSGMIRLDGEELWHEAKRKGKSLWTASTKDLLAADWELAE